MGNRGVWMSRRALSVVLVGSLLGVGGVAAPVVVAASAHAVAIGCPPGAFDDTDGVVKMIDKTVAWEMKRVEVVINAHVLKPGGVLVNPTTLPNGVLEQLTLTRSADGNQYTYELDMAQPAATPTFVLISSGSRTDEGVDANGVHTVNKQVSVDYDARAAFVPTNATGHFSATIVHVNDPSKPAPGNQDTLTVSFAGITVKPTDPHGPRTGSYTHVGETAIGGDLDYQASIPVPCPGNPAGPVEITVQRRHVDSAAGERTFRRDALVTGGSLTAGQVSIGFQCGTDTQTSTGQTAVQSNYLVHKIENADGTTQSYTVKFKNETAPNCNPAFGSLVSPTDNSTDSPFSHPVTFPGQW